MIKFFENLNIYSLEYKKRDFFQNNRLMLLIFSVPLRKKLVIVSFGIASYVIPR